MPVVKVDQQGIPYWVQPIGTRWDYAVDYTRAMRNVSDTVVSAVWSTITAGLAIASNAFTASGLHTIWVTPSAGNAGGSYYLRSKIFTQAGRIEAVRIKVVVESWD